VLLCYILDVYIYIYIVVVNDINCGSDKVIQWVPRLHKVLTHGQGRLFCKVTSVSIHSFVEWLDTFSYVLRPADVIVKEVNHIRCFAIYIANILYSFPVVLPKASEINRNDLLEYKEKKSTNGFPLFSLTILL
jgi:hypothetical protein